MVASEASFVIDAIISSELVHQVHSLVACHAFLGCTCKCHASDLLSDQIEIETEIGIGIGMGGFRQARRPTT